jgi:TetR/AcrR family transcriptional regulator, cholesterol catabolism regulator
LNYAPLSTTRPVVSAASLRGPSFEEFSLSPARGTSASQTDLPRDSKDPTPKGLERSSSQERVLDVVAHLLESEGYAKLQLVSVAQGAHMSLETIYKSFPSRDELIVAAVERWMDENVYKPLCAEPIEHLPVLDLLVDLFRRIFEPWMRHPRMLEAYVLASLTSPGRRLFAQGEAAVLPSFKSILSELEPSFVDDVLLILFHVNHSVVTSVASGTLDIKEVLPTFQRTLQRLLHS